MKIYLIYALFIVITLFALALNSRDLLLANIFSVLVFNLYQIMKINDVSTVKPNSKSRK